MAITNRTFDRLIGRKYVVTAGEASSGSCEIAIVETQNRTDEFLFNVLVTDSANKIKTDGLNVKYIEDSGLVKISNDDTNLAEDDIVRVSGQFL